MSDTLAYLDMRIAGCKEDGHDHIGFRLADIENIRASITALEAEVARKDGALRMVGVLKQLGGMMPGSKQIVDSVVEACADALKPANEG